MLAAAVIPARAFIRRLISKIHTVKKPYHMITLTAETISDLRTWLHFMSHYDSITFFRALRLTHSDSINMASDASKQGYGARFGARWIQGKYPPDWQKHHITVLELYPVFLLIKTFGPLIKNSNILFKNDNMAVTDIVNKNSSKDPTIMQIVRPLVLALIKFNVNLRMEHIPGVLNVIPDKLSRFQVTPEMLIQNKMHLTATPTPAELKPENWKLK